MNANRIVVPCLWSLLFLKKGKPLTKVSGLLNKPMEKGVLVLRKLHAEKFFSIFTEEFFLVRIGKIETIEILDGLF